MMPENIIGMCTRYVTNDNDTMEHPFKFKLV